MLKLHEEKPYLQALELLCNMDMDLLQSFSFGHISVQDDLQGSTSCRLSCQRVSAGRHATEPTHLPVRYKPGRHSVKTDYNRKPSWELLWIRLCSAVIRQRQNVLCYQSLQSADVRIYCFLVISLGI